MTSIVILLMIVLCSGSLYLRMQIVKHSGPEAMLKISNNLIVSSSVGLLATISFMILAIPADMPLFLVASTPIVALLAAIGVCIFSIRLGRMNKQNSGGPKSFSSVTNAMLVMSIITTVIIGALYALITTIILAFAK